VESGLKQNVSGTDKQPPTNAGIQVTITSPGHPRRFKRSGNPRKKHKDTGAGGTGYFERERTVVEQPAQVERLLTSDPREGESPFWNDVPHTATIRVYGARRQNRIKSEVGLVKKRSRRTKRLLVNASAFRRWACFCIEFELRGVK